MGEWKRYLWSLMLLLISLCPSLRHIHKHTYTTVAVNVFFCGWSYHIVYVLRHSNRVQNTKQFIVCWQWILSIYFILYVCVCACGVWSWKTSWIVNAIRIILELLAHKHESVGNVEERECVRAVRSQKSSSTAHNRTTIRIEKTLFFCVEVIWIEMRVRCV